MSTDGEVLDAGVAAAEDSKVSDAPSTSRPQSGAVTDGKPAALRFLSVRKDLVVAINNDRKQAGCVHSLHLC